MQMAVTAAGQLPDYDGRGAHDFERGGSQGEGSSMIEMGSLQESSGRTSEPNAMRIESSLNEGTDEYINQLSGWQIAKHLAAIVAVFILFTVIGSVVGPSRLLESTVDHDVTLGVLDKHPVFLSGIHFNADMPQFFFMEMSFVNKKNSRIKVTLDVVIQVDMSKERGGPVTKRQVYSSFLPVDCPAKSTCSGRRMLYYPTVQYKQYKVYTKIMNVPSDWEWIGRVNFAYTYKNLEYTQFEADWRYFFTSVGMLAWCMYIYACRVSQARRLTVEQIWATYLLGLLFFLNAPWYGFSLTTKNWLLTFITAACQATFIGALILFWLITLDIVSREQSFTPTFESFYLPKAAFVGVGAFFMTGYYTWLTWYQYEDATATAESRLGGSYTTIKYVLVTYLFVFLLWVLWYLIRACRELASLPTRSQGLLGYTVLSMLGFLCTLLTRWLAGEEDYNAAIFVAFTSLCNLYVIGLAWFCRPLKSTEVNLEGIAARA